MHTKAKIIGHFHLLSILGGTLLIDRLLGLAMERMRGGTPLFAMDEGGMFELGILRLLETAILLLVFRARLSSILGLDRPRRALAAVFAGLLLTVIGILATPFITSLLRELLGLDLARALAL
ncbi:MAG: hypothetical protein HQL31_08610 [Planctomycetes bacterium]|nr:hypothetical protein [Planctomycetota bacterium]